MNEDRLRTLLREVEIPDAEIARRRGLATTRAAFAERRPAAARSAPRRLALALAIATLGLAALLSPAGAAVREWIGETIPLGASNPAPSLTQIPGGGTLLVETPGGPWVVQADGSRRLLGPYTTATWSPRGLYVAAANDRTLSAIEPDGTPRWSLSASGSIAAPRWSPSGFRIAFEAGEALRVVAGDGSGGRTLARDVRPVAPAWWPLGSHVLTYVDGRGQVVVLEADTGAKVSVAPALPGVTSLSWRADGRRLLEAASDQARVREVRSEKLSNVTLGPARALDLGGAIRGAKFSPAGGRIAAIVRRRTNGDRPARSELVMLDSEGSRARTLLAVPGELTGPTWSPDGRRLLIGWPRADQWLFVPADSRGRIRAIAGISSAFAPGGEGNGVWPKVAGWCCARSLPGSTDYSG